MSESLLLTGTLKPFDIVLKTGYNSYTINPQKREKEYIDSIVYYITQTNFNRIVFIENSGTNFNVENQQLINYLANKYNKTLEILSFLGSMDKIKEKGYNYGEGECIDYAFQHSKILKKSKTWRKITGRYKCWNINELLDFHVSDDFYFYRFAVPGVYGVLTSIFKCNNTLYNNYLFKIKDLVDFKEPNYLRSYEMMCYFKLKGILPLQKRIKTLPIIHNQYDCSIRKNIGGGNLRWCLTINRFLLKYVLFFGSSIDRFLSFIFDKYYSKHVLKL